MSQKKISPDIWEQLFKKLGVPSGPEENNKPVRYFATYTNNFLLRVDSLDKFGEPIGCYDTVCIREGYNSSLGHFYTCISCKCRAAVFVHTDVMCIIRMVFLLPGHCNAWAIIT